MFEYFLTKQLKASLNSLARLMTAELSDLPMVVSSLNKIYDRIVLEIEESNEKIKPLFFKHIFTLVKYKLKHKTHSFFHSLKFLILIIRAPLNIVKGFDLSEMDKSIVSKLIPR